MFNVAVGWVPFRKIKVGSFVFFCLSIYNFNMIKTEHNIFTTELSQILRRSKLISGDLQSTLHKTRTEIKVKKSYIRDISEGKDIPSCVPGSFTSGRL